MASFTDCTGLVVKPDVTVSQQGDADYKTVSEAVDSIPSDLSENYIIHIRAGIYEEYVTIDKSKVTIIGDGIGKTILTSRRSQQGTGHSIQDSAALVVLADSCIFKCISFENTSSDVLGQAVALRSQGDLNVFYQCEFKGYQDTLYVNAKDGVPRIGRHFFRECNILGTIDFMFGDAQMVLQKCQITFRQPSESKSVAMTASGRTQETDDTGIVVQCCDISADFAAGSTKLGYLGRAWKQHARVVLMKNTIAGVIDPAGWTNMSLSDFSRTAEFIEFDNAGPGASTAGRIQWPKYKATKDPADVQHFTVEEFINGSTWLPATGVPFDLGLDC